MRSRRAALGLGLIAVCGAGLGACGGGDALVDSVPKSTPDLTVPAGASGLPSVSTTSTTSTTDTTATSTGTTPSPSAPSQQATPQTPAPSTSTPSSGGTQVPQQTTPTTTPNSGGTPAGGLSDFCRQNPGACGQ